MTQTREQLMSKATYWLGVDLGGTKMLAALFNDKFKLLVERKEKTGGHDGAKAVIGRCGIGCEPASAATIVSVGYARATSARR